MRDSNERLLAENKKLLETIKDHEAKEKNEELKGQAQLLEILKNQTSSSSGRTSGRKGAKAPPEKKADAIAEREHQDSQTPESSEQDSCEKTAIMADAPGDEEALQVPTVVQNVDEPKEDGASGSLPSSDGASESQSDHQSNIQADTDHGVPSANQAIATKQFESGIASHQNEEEDATSNDRSTIHTKALDSIKKKKREDGELSSSESAEEDHEGIAKDTVKGSIMQRPSARASEITDQDQRVSEVIHQGEGSANLKVDEDD